MASITLKNIKKVYDNNLTVINNLNLEIDDKEFIVLVGPSGCGKSTLLRMIAGLEKISDGEMFIGERLVNNIPPKNRDIAMVFQNYALYPHMTVYKNMAFGLENRKIEKKEIEKRVFEAAKILDIENLLKRKPKAMSGGQRQRVALGRAMVREPQVFLLDEPLSNLDAKLRTSMRTEIVKLHKRISTTFIYVTHDQTEAMTMGDRIVVMKDGYIQQVGTPKELYEKPYNEFVAGFIGTPRINFMDMHVKKDNDGFYLIPYKDDSESYDFSIRLNNPRLNLDGYINKVVTLGIRPEHINISKCGQFGSKVELVEILGSESYIYVKFNENQVIIKVNGSTDIEPDTDINIDFQESYIYLFDKEQGISIK